MMNENISRYLSQQTCATIGCTDEQGMPYCFNCYYAFNEEEGLLYFKSSEDAYHMQLMKQNHRVAGTILPDKLSKLVIKGVQLQGELLDTENPLAHKAAMMYHQKHPLSLAVPGKVWTIRFNALKMTDSTLGIGKKICWRRQEQIVCGEELLHQ